MKNDYQKLMQEIHAPRELERRVMAATEETPVRRRGGFAARAAVCAVLALALVLGGISLRPAEQPPEQTLPDTPSVPQLEYTFGLPACAAGIGANGGVLLESVDGQDLEKLEGTVQTLSLTFADGRQESGKYMLRKELLGAFTNEDGTEVLAPALTGDPAETISGLYAVPEESVWFLWPVEGSNTVSLSAPYGLRADGAAFHSGIDIPAPTGTGIAAAAAGVVTEAGYDTARGNYLILDHGDGMITLYAHCQEVLAETGKSVAAGETIALVGATGMATGPHLHFEVREDGTAQNPVAYFDSSLRDTLKMG